MGVLSNTPTEILKKLRADIIDAVAASMNIQASIVRPFFPSDMAGDLDGDGKTHLKPKGW